MKKQAEENEEKDEKIEEQNTKIEDLNESMENLNDESLKGKVKLITDKVNTRFRNEKEVEDFEK